jgi:hypothetical protein
MEKYNLNEGNDALNRVLLMMSYDLSKTLDEQKIPTNKDLQKYQQGGYKNAVGKYVDKTATSFRGPDGKQKTTATSPKMLKDLPASHMTLDEFMEGYREALSHPVMVGLEVFLLSTGVGVGGVVAVYVVLLAYDVYKGVTTGNWDWLNIIFEVLAIVSAGVLNKPLIPILRVAKSLKLNTLDKVLKFLSKTKIWPEIKSFLNSGVDILKSISKNINKFFKWLSQKTGFKFIENIPSKVQGAINSIINGILNFLKSVVEPFSKVGIKQAAKRAVGWGTFAYFFKEKIVPYLKGLSNEKTIFKRGVDKAQDEILDIIAKENKNLFKNKINQMIIVTNSDYTLNMVIIDDKEYELLNNYKLKQK